MGDPYHVIEEKGFYGDGPNAIISLYPNTSNEDENTSSGSYITNGLIDVFNQLMNADQIGYYKIKRFHAEQYDYYYPGVDTSESTSIGDQFINYLEDGDNGNGTGNDLHSLAGVHLLVHDEPCNHNNAGGEANADSCNTIAFTQGLASWTTVCADPSLRKNSAIQETLHHFLDSSDSYVEYAAGDCGIYDAAEHYLGRRNSNSNITPMLTYYEDDSPCGYCSGNDTNWDGWTQNLTHCTKKAVNSSWKCNDD